MYVPFKKYISVLKTQCKGALNVIPLVLHTLGGAVTETYHNFTGASYAPSSTLDAVWMTQLQLTHISTHTEPFSILYWKCSIPGKQCYRQVLKKVTEKRWGSLFVSFERHSNHIIAPKSILKLRQQFACSWNCACKLQNPLNLLFDT